MQSETPKRLDSVDLLRGLVMILMAVDHVRYPYFTNIGIPAENTHLADMSLFLTRWITHFCAPLFFLLAGTGAYLMTTRGKPVAEVSQSLWKRGLWLVFLELTVIGFAWSFMPGWGFAGVIWALGWSMVILALVIRLPLRAVVVFGSGMIVLQHLTDGILPDAPLWKFIHGGGYFHASFLPGGFFPILYTIVPGCGVMAAGFALGAVLQKPEQERRKWLLYAGLAISLLFVVLRATNWYGSPPNPVYGENVPPEWRHSNDFAVQETAGKTVIAFLNTQKYPISFQFLLMTIGPGLMLLSWFDRFDYSSKLGKWIGQKIVVFGRVPMFYYILHIFLIHLLAILVCLVSGLPTGWLVGKALPFMREAPEGFGFGLAGTYLVALIVVTLLYFPCKWFADLKRRRKDWWLSYL